MPRETYYQSTGNPTQKRNLPRRPMSIEFAYRSSNPDSDDTFTRTYFGNLYLLSGAALAADWMGSAFGMLFPFNVLVVGLMLRGLLKLWKLPSAYQPSLWLLAVPYLLHIIGLAFVVRTAIVVVCAAYAGRAFARHFVYVTTGFPRKNAEHIRAQWDIITLYSALLVIPVGLAVAAPHAAGLCGLILIVGTVASVLLTGGDPFEGFANLFNAWHSWCSYNRADEAAPGTTVSPAGSLATRLGMIVLLVVSVTLLITDATGISETVWGGSGFHFGNILVWTVSVLAFVAVPVVIAVALVSLVAFPAVCRSSPASESSREENEWQQVTKAIRKSANPVERDSIYVGRVSHDGSPLLVPRAVFQEHAHLLGDSGSGKTARGLIPLAEQLIADGNSSLMVIDLKGDSQEILASLTSAASRHGKQTPLRYFSIREDQSTFAFNPFQLPCWNRLNLFQRTDVVCGALGLIYGTEYGQGYFSSANAMVLHATLKHFPDVASFADLADRIAYVTQRPKAHGLSESKTEAGNHVWMVAERLASFKPLNVTPQSAPTTEVSQRAMDPAQLFERQEIFYFHLSTTLGPGSSPEIARLAMFMLLTTATLTPQRRQVYLMIDEFQRVAAHNVDAILQIARSMNVGVILANQSMLDLKREDLISVVETNCRYRQWYAISSPEEQERLSKGSGQTVDQLHSASVSTQRDGLDTRTTVSHSTSQFIAPRLSTNDIKLASDDPSKSIVLVTRGDGYSQFGGMPVIADSEYHISEEEFLRRKHMPWPAGDPGTFVPQTWTPQSASKPQTRKRKSSAPLVTEETIGEPPTKSLFDHFLGHQNTLS